MAQANEISGARARSIWKSAAPLAGPADAGPWRAPVGISIGLALLVMAAFWPVTNCGFLNFDDDFYITGNPLVKSGFHWSTIKWAFGHTAMGLYHPLTILSLALDAQRESWLRHGLTPEAFHIENLGLHAANTIILFLVMWRMTSSQWRSALAVGLWAVHPLRVESVAWIVERKDELAGLFGFLAIGAYVAYARRGGAWRYATVLVLLTLSLLAKPMMATLPAGLLLLDLWPMKRLGAVNKGQAALGRLAWLAAEKLPMLLIVAFDVHVGDVLRTLEPGESQGTAFAGMNGVRLGQFISNSLAVLPVYLQKMADFSRLTVFYPKHAWALWQVGLGACVLVAVTAAAVWQWRRPWLGVGWLWFLIMLAPSMAAVMGLEFSMADRYTYAPSIGLAIMAAWSVPAGWITGRWRWHVAGLFVCVLLQLSICTWVQCTYWTSSVRLWKRCLDTAGDNWLADGNMAAALDSEGRGWDAMDYYKRAVKANERFVGGHLNLGRVQSKLRYVDQAAGQFRRVTELDPLSPDGWYWLGFNYADPSTAKAWQNLGEAGTDTLEKLYRLALPNFDRAIILSPDNVDVAFARAETLLALHRPGEAIQAYRRAIADAPGFAKGHNNLGVALALSGKYQEAADEFRAALRIAPKYPEAMENLRDAMGHLAGAATRPG